MKWTDVAPAVLLKLRHEDMYFKTWCPVINNEGGACRDMQSEAPTEFIQWLESDPELKKLQIKYMMGG